jgi:hypothetical protein
MRGVVGVSDAVVLVQALGQKREERQVVCDDASAAGGAGMSSYLTPSLPSSLPSSMDKTDRGRVLSWRMRRALSQDGRMGHHQVGHILGGGWSV